MGKSGEKKIYKICIENDVDEVYYAVDKKTKMTVKKTFEELPINSLRGSHPSFQTIKKTFLKSQDYNNLLEDGDLERFQDEWGTVY